MEMKTEMSHEFSDSATNIFIVIFLHYRVLYTLAPKTLFYKKKKSGRQVLKNVY